MTRVATMTALLLLAAPLAVHAQNEVTADRVNTWTFMVEEQEYEVRPATPTYSGDTGLFHLSSAYILPRGKVSFSAFRDNLDRDPKDEDISIHGLSAAFGLVRRVELFASFGLQNRLDADALDQPGFVNEFPFVSTPWETGVGDLKAGLKVSLLDDRRGDPFAVALRAHVKIPTADEQKGLGTGKVSAGGDLIVSRSLGTFGALHASVGYLVHADPDGLNLGNAVLWGAGIDVGAAWLHAQAEVLGANYGSAAFKQTNPIDLVVGPVLVIKPGIFFRPALSWNLRFDDRGLGSSSRSWTGRHFSIGFHPGAAGRRVASAAATAILPRLENHPPVVTCATERASAPPGVSVGVVASGSDPDGDPLQYTWGASAGTIVGSGARVNLDTTGAAAPSTITITVRVSDGRGGAAAGNCSLRVERAEQALQAVTCTSGGFPRNRARLNNVDKACLDDVATRLRREPRSLVTIVGHADIGERYPEVISRKRAEATKDYLVKERGIDGSRITVRGAADTRPLDSSRRPSPQNRRVELFFASEPGATP
jgi:outer membrane protein OmpA-like peptidoglycan-associated protein